MSDNQGQDPNQSNNQVPKPVEQEIEIGGDYNAPANSTPVSSTPAQETTSTPIDTFNAARPDQSLTDSLSGTQTAEELLDAILNIPQDRLIPWEEIPLPSKGLYYDGQIPGGVVKLKAMGTHADKILATARLAQTGQSIDYLLEHCVQLPNKFPTSELLAGDRTYLLYALRGITHGNNYEFMIACPNCEAMQNCAYDLNELGNTVTFGRPSIREPAKVVLPYLSEISKKECWVTVRFLRGKDISALAQRQRFNKRVGGATIRPGVRPSGAGGPNRPTHKPITVDDTLTENLNLIVTSFMGIENPAKIAQLVAGLHSSDTAAIRELLRKNSPGIDTTITVKCIDCDTEFRTELPITESFFRPSQSS